MKRVSIRTAAIIGIPVLVALVWLGSTGSLQRLTLTPLGGGKKAPETALAQKLVIKPKSTSKASKSMTTPQPGNAVTPNAGQSSAETPAPPAVPQEPTPAPVVHGVYSTGWIAGSTKFFPRLLTFVKQANINALVVDVKDDTGTISYTSNIPLAKATNASERKIPNFPQFMETLKQSNVYPIARIVAFKDPHLAKARPDLAIRNKEGGIWYDRKGQSWVDPNNREVWDYLVAIGKEAAAAGFKEIQYDYVRFASDGKLSNIVYPYSTGLPKAQVIKNFLAYARKQLEPYGIVLSADVFGLVCSVPDDLGIGQQLELIADEVDYISPMVYPSHFYAGTYGIANPNSKPYETVLRSMQDAQKRIAGKRAKLRPWLQDFSLGYPYGRAELQAQLTALRDAGVTEWLFWNPSCRYDASKY